MRCFGKTIKGKRCQNSTSFLFCRFHLYQPILLLFTLGTSIIYVDELFAALNLKKPVTYINNVLGNTRLESYNCKSFGDKSNQMKLNILLMPLGTKASCKIQDNKYHHSLRDRFYELASSTHLGFICTIDTVFCEYTDDQITNIAKQLNANLVIWGDYIEYCDWDTTLINIKFAFSDNGFQIEKDSTNNVVSKYNMVRLIESGKLTGSIEDILFYTLAINEFGNGNYYEAINLFKKVIIRPKSQLGHPVLLAGLSYFMLGDYVNAVDLLDISTKYDAKYFLPEVAYFFKGEANQKLNNYSEALSDYSLSILSNPEYINAYIGRANTYKALQEYEYVYQDANCAFEIDSNNEKSILLLTEYFYQSHDFCKSYFFASKLAMDESNEYYFRMCKARCYQQIGASKLSKFEFESLVFTYPDSSIPKILLGGVYLQQNDSIGFNQYIINTLNNYPKDTMFRNFFFEPLFNSKNRFIQ